MILAPSEFVFVVMNSMMFETAGHEAIIGLPAVGVNVTWGEDVSPKDRHQLLFGAVLDDTDEDPISSFVKT